jgi:hypothetical protein
MIKKQLQADSKAAQLNDRMIGFGEIALLQND